MTLADRPRASHEGPQAQKLMSTITMIFSVAPAIAPVIGGWIHVWFGWRYVFAFMVMAGVSLMLLSYALLQEGRDLAAAERALRDILVLEPENESARHNLSLLLQRLGRVA